MKCREEKNRFLLLFNVIGIIGCLCLFLTGTTVKADTIYLQNKPEGNQGEILEEYPDSIIIRFPKNEIKRIEANEKPPSKQKASSQQIIWIDDGETITLRLPKRSVQITSSESLKSHNQGFPPQKSATSLATLPSISSSIQGLLSQNRIIQGKVLMRGTPLPNCKIRILKVSNSVKDRMLNMFSGSTEEGKEKQSFEASTDESGLYTFKNIPFGEYILYWKPKGSKNWIRRLSENPDITLVPGRPVAVKNIETNVRTVN